MWFLENPRVSSLPTPAHPEKGCRAPFWLGTKRNMNTLALLWSGACPWVGGSRLAHGSHGNETVTSHGLLNDCGALWSSHVSSVTAKAALGEGWGEEGGQRQPPLGCTLGWLHLSPQEYVSGCPLNIHYTGHPVSALSIASGRRWWFRGIVYPLCHPFHHLLCSKMDWPQEICPSPSVGYKGRLQK